VTNVLPVEMLEMVEMLEIVSKIMMRSENWSLDEILAKLKNQVQKN